MRQPKDETRGRMIEKLLADRGLTYRGAEAKTGVNYNTVSRVAQGYSAEMESVVRLAQGLGQPVNEWLALFGYEPVEPSGSEILDAGLKALGREFDRPIRISFDEESKVKLTPDEAFRTLAYYRKEVEEGRM